MKEMSEETYNTLREMSEWYRNLRCEKPRDRDLTPEILALAEKHSDPETRWIINTFLRDNYLLQKNFPAATAISLREIEDRPLAAMPLLILAGQRHFSEGNPQEAVELAKKAVLLADAAQEFRRHSRAVLLRAAADLSDVDTVRQCLVEIMELKLLTGEQDVGREADLLVRAEKAGVEEAILARYRQFLQPRS